MNAFLRFATLALAAGLPAAAFAQISINAPPSTSFAGALFQNTTGGSGSSAYAQTFQTPDAANTRLDSFAFYLTGVAANAGVNFSAYVMDWDAGTSHPIGAPLWTSALQSTVGLPNSPSYTRFAFDTGGLELNPGTTYSLFLFAEQNASANRSFVGYVAGYYPGGSLYDLHGASIGSLAGVSGLSSTNFSTLDFAFDASFSDPSIPSVPEPSTAGAALTAAFLAVAACLRLRRARTALPTSTAPSATMAFPTP